MFGIAYAIGFLNESIAKRITFWNDNSFSAFLAFRPYRSGGVSSAVLAVNCHHQNLYA